MIINRHIINPNISYDGMNRDELFSLISRWKRLLVTKYGAAKGQTLALAIITVNPNHIACVFAAAELGMRLLVITKPLAHETVHATKMGIFGPVDITVAQTFNEGDPHETMVQRYSHKLCREEEIDTFTDDTDVPPVDVSPDDDLIFMSTSGTTGKSKPIMFSHREVYEISKRNIDAFDYTKDSVVVHTHSFHHASGMLTFIIPSMMVADKHFYGGISWIPVVMRTTYQPEEFVTKFIVQEKADMLMVTMPNAVTWLKDYIEKYKDQIHHTVKLNTSGYTLPEEFYEYTKQVPLELYSHYGSTETGIPLLINHVTKDSQYEPNLLGIQVDDFYRLHGDTVSCHLWNEPKPLPDRLRFENGKYYFESRLEETEEVSMPLGTIEMINEQFGEHVIVPSDDKPFLVVWRTSNDIEDLEQAIIAGKSEMQRSFKKIVYLNKIDFRVDTKVSMEQLRAYLEHHYAV